MLEERITREDGYVAIQHHNSNPATVMIEADKTVYMFTPRLSISMCWIAPNHVDAIMRIKTNVCCGRTGNKFIFASQIGANLWEFGHR